MKKFLCLILLGMGVCLPATAQTQTTIRVRCGGAKYTDSKGDVWQADFGFKEGKAVSNTKAVSGTPDPALFATYHWDPGTYSFQLPDGKYQVNLYFAEGTPADEKIGARVFDVSVQGADVFPKFDIFREVGANAALIKTTTATVTNGTLKIAFKYDSGSEPAINAMEILPAGQAFSGPTLMLSSNIRMALLLSES